MHRFLQLVLCLIVGKLIWISYSLISDQYVKAIEVTLLPPKADIQIM